MEFDKKRLVEVGKELGLEVTFNSDNPGIYNSKTGEHKSFDEVFEDLFKSFKPSSEED